MTVNYFILWHSTSNVTNNKFFKLIRHPTYTKDKTQREILPVNNMAIMEYLQKRINML
jgi:hypothetical protein